MSVLKNLRSIFIVDNQEEKKEKVDKTANTSSTNDAKTAKQKVDPAVENTGKRDDKIIDTLFNAMEKNNLSGFDYLEFKTAIQGLEKMVVDEATRFKSAFATASTIGVTMDKLIESADHYAKVLDKEKNKFIEAASQQSSNLIDNKNKELQQLLKTLEGKKKMIEQMQDELIKGEGRIKTIQDGIKNSTVKIDNTKRNFEASWSLLKNQIVTDIDKMRRYLK